MARPGVSADDLKNGRHLDVLAAEHCVAFRKALPEGHSLGPALTLRWCTICSGGEVVLFVLLAIARAFAKYGVKLHFVHVFSCECVPKLQDWLIGLFAEVGATVSLGDGCLFERAEHMGANAAKCRKHGGRCCTIPDADLVIAGTSCKDFSKALGTSAKVKQHVLDNSTSTGGSAQTFHGLISYLMNHVVTMLLFENVDTLDEGGDDNDSTSSAMAVHTALNSVCDAFEEAALRTLVMLSDAAEFGLPTVRLRYYILAVNPLSPLFKPGAREVLKDSFKLVLDLVKLCQREPPDVRDVLYDEADDSVDAEMARRMTAGTRLGEYNVGSSIIQHSASNMRWGDTSRLPRTTKQSPWYKTLCPTQRNALAFSLAEKPLPIMREISQSISRVRYSKKRSAPDQPDKEIACCMMPQQCMWLYGDGKLGRLMLGREGLIIQGYPVASVPCLVEKTAEGTMMSIAGNMMASTVPLAIVMAAFAALPWADSSAAPLTTTEDQCDDALKVFDLVHGQASTSAGTPSPPRNKKRRKVVQL